MTQAKNNFNDKGSIFLKFSFLGGFIGGLLLGVVIAVSPTMSPFQSQCFWQKVAVIPFSAIFGAIFGLMPASLTALWVVLRNLSFYRNQDYVEVLFIGLSMTTLSMWLIRPIFDKDILIFSIIGALSAVITSYRIFRKKRKT